MKPATSAQPTLTPRSTQPCVDVTQAGRSLQSLVMDRGEPDQVMSDVVDIVAGLTGALGVAFVSRDSSQRLTINPQHYAPRQFGQLRSLLQFMLRISTVACSEQAPQAATMETDDDLLVISVPVTGSLHGSEAIALAVGLDAAQQTRKTSAYLTQLLTWIAAFIAVLRRPTPEHRHGDTVDENGLTGESLDELNQLLVRAVSEDSFQKSAQVITEWLRKETASPIVAIGVRGRRQQPCRLVGYSGAGQFDHRALAVRQIQDVIEETVISCQMHAEGEPDEELLATSSLDALRVASQMRITRRFPLHDAVGDTFGAILLMTDDQSQVTTQNDRGPSLAPQVLRLLGTSLALLHAAEPSWVDRVCGLRTAGRPWYRRRGTWVAATGSLLLLLLPMPLKVGCPCRVQPKHRRFVSVPYEGRLEEALTEAGEVVKQGQLLARMDPREIEWELAGLTADLRRADKDRDTALAAYDTAATQMAALEVQRLQLQIDLLHDRLRHLEIRSPVDGIVIGGDPRKIEGARMSMGQTILEVGPLDRMVVELAISDEDIAHIASGQPVRYRLAALPWKTLQGQVHRIRPRSELRDNANVFIAEIDVGNDDLAMRPGMRGRAKIKTSWHPLGWNLFHKAWDGLVTRMRW